MSGPNVPSYCDDPESIEIELIANRFVIRWTDSNGHRWRSARHGGTGRWSLEYVDGGLLAGRPDVAPDDLLRLIALGGTASIKPRDAR